MYNNKNREGTDGVEQCSQPTGFMDFGIGTRHAQLLAADLRDVETL